MTTIAYSSPLVPPEWIAAHGCAALAAAGRDRAARASPAACALLPRRWWTTRRRSSTARPGFDDRLRSDALRGRAADRSRPPAAVSPQRAFHLANRRGGELYRRSCSGWPVPGRFRRRPPGHDELARVCSLTIGPGCRGENSPGLSARQWAEALVALRGLIPNNSDDSDEIIPIAGANSPGAAASASPWPSSAAAPEGDYEFFDLVEHCGGRVVLDARRRPADDAPPFDAARVAADPLRELPTPISIRFPTPFVAPTRAVRWLGRELAARQVRGIIFRRYAWCDLWHAELQRLKDWTPLPCWRSTPARRSVRRGRTEGESRPFWRCSGEPAARRITLASGTSLCRAARRRAARADYGVRSAGTWPTATSGC